MPTSGVSEEPRRWLTLIVRRSISCCVAARRLFLISRRRFLVLPEVTRMTGFDTPLNLSKAWNRAALDSMLAAAGFSAALAESTLRLWSGAMVSAGGSAERASAIQTWYRASFPPWHTAFAAVGLAALRVWAPPSADRRDDAGASGPDLQQRPQPIAPAPVFSAYRSDGGHATAQIRVDTPSRAARPCAIDAPGHLRHRKTSSFLH